jgi:uncharacterized membrane protein HdeD (DUF308 family)
MIPALVFSLAGLGAWALVTGGAAFRDWQISGETDAAFAGRLGILAGVALVVAAVTVALARAMLLAALAAGQGMPT